MLSGLMFGNGGGNGETDIEVTLAECAWYTRRDWNRGSDNACCWMLVVKCA